MAAESPVIGQFRQVPSSAEPHPFPIASSNADPLQGLVHEMALSAVIQKHGSGVPSSCHSPHPAPTHNGTIIKNYVVPAQGSSSSEQLGGASPLPQAYSSVPPQAAGVMLGGSQQGFITLSSTQANNVSLLAHPQASPVLQGAPITVPQLPGQLHEVSSPAASAQSQGSGSMVQLTPVCYDGTQNAQPSPVVERSAVMQPNVVG